MEAGSFYFDLEETQVFMVVGRMKLSSRMKIRFQDGIISSKSLEDLAGRVETKLGDTFNQAMAKYPELEYEMRLCLLDDLD